MESEPLDSPRSPTLKDRWNRLSRHMRIGAGVLAFTVVVVAVKAGVSMRAETVTQLPDNLIQKNDCQTDQDCNGPHLICNAKQRCEALPNPTGFCTQPQVLTYAGTNGQAKHTFCKKGCAITEKGARCL